jgi:hypothetical protein
MADRAPRTDTERMDETTTQLLQALAASEDTIRSGNGYQRALESRCVTAESELTQLRAVAEAAKKVGHNHRFYEDEPGRGRAECPLCSILAALSEGEGT